MRFFARPPRFKAFRQLESSDCGLACAKMIARHYGKDVSFPFLRSVAEVNRQGMTLGDFKDIFRHIGMICEGVRVTEKDLESMPLPAVLLWRGNHFVVLYHRDNDGNRFWIADPEEGKQNLDRKRFLEDWKQGAEKGIAILAEPGSDFDQTGLKEASPRPSLFGLLKLTVSRHKRPFIWLMVLSLLCMGADLGLPLLTQAVVDDGIARRDIGLVWIFAAFQLAVAVGYLTFSNVVQHLALRLGQSLNLEMMRDYLARILSLPLDFFNRKSPADLIQKTDDQSRIKDFILQFPNSILLTCLSIVAFATLLLLYSLPLLLLFLALTSLEACWQLVFLPKRRNLDYSYFALLAKNRNVLHETVHGIQAIKAAGAGKSILDRWSSLQQELIRLGIRSHLLQVWMGGGLGLLTRLKDVTMGAICATMVIKGNLTLGEMLAVGYVMGRLSGPFNTILSMAGQLQDARISMERLDEIKTFPNLKPGVVIPDCASLRLVGAGFRYPGKSSPWVLEDIDLKIQAGTTTAIVGESGCGKTTMLKLLLGFYLPQHGRLELGGVEASTADLDDWISRCGVVMQDGFLFSDTIMRNIALADDSPDMEKVCQVAELAGIASFVKSLPLGYQTPVGATGVELSGGQRQRLLIARALYGNPDILVLDEATSSLDAATEAMVSKRIMDFQKGKTLIIAAHRLSTVKLADTILYMENGRIVESGTHRELLALKGGYWKLVRSQLE